VALNAYLAQTQRLLHDPAAIYFSTADLTAYINIARSQAAIESQSVRALISGFVASVAVNAGGTNYSAQTSISFASPSGGTGAVATPTIAAGVITAVTMVAPGSGFDTGATAVASDPTGAGHNAVLTPTVSGANMLVIGQEVYTFASRQTQAQLTPGVSAIHGVLSITASWGASRPMLGRKDWTTFQAKYRPWAAGWLNNPVVWAQYGQGAKGSVYLAPIPANAFNMEWDTYCVPIPLVDDTTVEAIPYPWTDAIPYYAAYLAASNAQRAQDASSNFGQYEAFMKRARSMSETPFIPDAYE